MFPKWCFWVPGIVAALFAMVVLGIPLAVSWWPMIERICQ